MAEQQPSAQDTANRVGQLGLQRIYLKDMSFEAPNTPQIFREEWKPNVDIQMGHHAALLGNDLFDVTLTVTVTVKFQDKTVFLVEVKQAGVFNISGFPEQHLKAALATICPNILYPYAREAVSDIVAKAGFPQLLLQPVNFEALYAQQLQRQKDMAAKPGAVAEKPN